MSATPSWGEPEASGRIWLRAEGSYYARIDWSLRRYAIYPKWEWQPLPMAITIDAAKAFVQMQYELSK